MCAKGSLNSSYSYRGSLKHDGSTYKAKEFLPWSQGSILGFQLDLRRGTMELFHNREYLGVAFRGQLLSIYLS